VGTNNGTLLGGAAFAPGKVGQAFSFDGVNALVQVLSSPALSFNSNSPMTVELWAYRTGSASSMSIIGKRITCGATFEPINYQMGFNMPAGEGLFFGAGGGGHSATSKVDMVMNTWTHLAGTFEGSNCCLYIDGTLRATQAASPGPQNTAPFLIGGSANCEKFAGLVDEVCIYDRALTANEIAAIYNAGIAGKCGRPTVTRQPRNQVGYWGKSVTFTVGTAGEPPLSYQWHKDAVPIDGATCSSLVLTNLQMTDSGNYSVVVTNSLGSTTSSNAYLTMNPAGVSLALYAGVTIDGVPGLTYGIQYTTDLSNTNSWQGAANVTPQPRRSVTTAWCRGQSPFRKPQRESS